MLDLAVYREGQSGQRVFMDFNRNPLPVPGDLAFGLDRLDADVSTYLHKAGAVQPRPIDRLRYMNPLANELYRRYKVDIATEPLEVAVNNQHMNGGIAVDGWGRASVGGVYAVGEAAGTQRMTRPGGAALNAGQVFGTRVGEHIAASGMADAPATTDVVPALKDAVARIKKVVHPDSPMTARGLRDEIQAPMSDSAGILCTGVGRAEAQPHARALNAKFRSHGIAPTRTAETARVLQWQQMATASEAVLTALDYYISHDGGSRDAREICDPSGSAAPLWNSGSLRADRFCIENPRHQQVQIAARLQGDEIGVASRPVCSFDEAAKPFFEKDWPAWLTGTTVDRATAES